MLTTFGFKRSATITVWEPRYHDRTILIACYKVANNNTIKITKGAYKGKYKLSGIAARSYPKESNGTIMCYAVPIDKLQRI